MPARKDPTRSLTRSRRVVCFFGRGTPASARLAEPPPQPGSISREPRRDRCRKEFPPIVGAEQLETLVRHTMRASGADTADGPPPGHTYENTLPPPPPPLCPRYPLGCRAFGRRRPEARRRTLQLPARLGPGLGRGGGGGPFGAEWGAAAGAARAGPVQHSPTRRLAPPCRRCRREGCAAARPHLPSHAAHSGRTSSPCHDPPPAALTPDLRQSYDTLRPPGSCGHCGTLWPLRPHQGPCRGHLRADAPARQRDVGRGTGGRPSRRFREVSFAPRPHCCPGRKAGPRGWRSLYRARK